MFHRIEFIGRLGKEPELKSLPSGEVCELSVATDFYKNSEKQTAWFRVMVWGTMARTAAQSLHKGHLVFIEGRLDPDDTGNPKVFTRRNGEPGANYEVLASKILFLTPKSKEENKYNNYF